MEHDWHASHEMFEPLETRIPCIGREHDVRAFLKQWEQDHGRSPRTGCASYQDQDGGRTFRLT